MSLHMRYLNVRLKADREARAKQVEEQMLAWEHEEKLENQMKEMNVKLRNSLTADNVNFDTLGRESVVEKFEEIATIKNQQLANMDDNSPYYDRLRSEAEDMHYSLMALDEKPDLTGMDAGTNEEHLERFANAIY